ncbi:amino acid permease [Clostridium autoethanogenum]|uniref:Amino acid permease n=1 Tax=Clostridium autoethanogenum DSM 10061 TaxID=1341692 RepID=A0ABN4BAJ5_9CLOT|nr:amino acid permease [Clostridium autoethanogenum]AGY74636.1 amino acid permease [Clostridium autoethanogenum DSM 10061]ALU34818.1 Amino acid/polyamine transporter I [Clostridium autoethanogenum DSM 10061]OVY51539.1 putative amino acid permease YhdG [Clostridium autoethanogenum]
MKNIFRTKPIESLLAETKGKNSLEKSLGAFELTMLGIGAIVGTGIFVLTGIAAAKYSGPALVISFIIAGLACGFAALCYAEIAAMVPVAGSAYTYGYAALGEFWAWIIGWDLILEYAFSVGTVAIGWSGYFVSILGDLGIKLPNIITKAPFEGGLVNLPAVAILVVITGILVAGVKQSAATNNIIVAIKLAVVLLFIVLGVRHVHPANWHPFMPYGWKGVFSGASVIFFAYIGFDAVSTAAEEVKDPKKDLPKGIIASLIICTVLYIAVSAILTGMVPYLKFKDTAAPVAFALQQVGINWGSALVSVGAICGLTSVLIVMLFGQTRVLFAMSRDGLLPRVFGQVNQRFHTPVKSTLLVGIITMIIAGFTPISVVSELTNIGTLAAFIIVSASVIVLRKREPDRPRSFKVPFSPVTPVFAMAACAFLIYNLQKVTLVRFAVWLVVGLIIYFVYGNSHSVMNDEDFASTQDAAK